MIFFKKYCLLGLTVGFLTIFNSNLKSQNNAGKFKLEITKAKIGVNIGPYRGRTPETDGPFNQGIAGFSQIYFPFQLAADYRKNFNDSIITNEYNNRVFLIRPSVLFHYVDNGSMIFGVGTQLSFLIWSEFYFEYQISGVYLEANKKGEPDLHDGFNLHHIVSISKPISRHFSLATSYVHMSGAGLGSGIVSNQDVITLGIKWNL
ncbi:MAG: hypothetical protein COB15_12730 [Flavobacteriales bacterium]|nr:MAG: hypothetical protein COB15_12730 [Flavobacteriales bacterium]